MPFNGKKCGIVVCVPAVIRQNNMGQNVPILETYRIASIVSAKKFALFNSALDVFLSAQSKPCSSRPQCPKSIKLDGIALTLYINGTLGYLPFNSYACVHIVSGKAILAALQLGAITDFLFVFVNEFR